MEQKPESTMKTCGFPDCVGLPKWSVTADYGKLGELVLYSCWTHLRSAQKLARSTTVRGEIPYLTVTARVIVGKRRV
jgi:hypothetical protein